MTTNEINKVTGSSFYSALVRFIETMNVQVRDFSADNELKVVSAGKRYAKIAVCRGGKADYLYCFVDLTNGDLLKGSWKAPVANGVRGNLTDPNVADKFNWHGPKYLRGN